MSDIVPSAIDTFKASRISSRALAAGKSVHISRELDDCRLCEAWGLTQNQLDEMSEEEILMRKLVSHATAIESKSRGGNCGNRR